jgi:hypothetical protein
MATKRILKLTNTEAVIKIDGAPGSVTIDLAVDLKLPTEEIVGTPNVSILQMHVAGKPTGVASVSRNSVNLWDLQASTAEKIDMLTFGGTADNTLAEHDIVVTTTNAETQLLVKLRKTSGYKTLIRTEQTGLQEPNT